MKTITLKLFAIAFSFVTILVSCSKNNGNTKSRTELLVQKNWEYEIAGLDENNNGVIEESENGLLTCQSDDVFTFHSNGTGVLTTGSLQCTPGEPSATNFSWSFMNNETELAIFGAPEMIGKLDENTLEVYYMDQNSQNQPVKYIRRFQH
jgi:hypothetical protein